nr:hypothetical protein [Tanacetum cinerariifolium]
MNQEQIHHVTAHDEKWVPTKKRVKISTTNVRLDTIVPQKEETFQVIINVIKKSTCYKAFTISAEVSEIFMQHFCYTIKKILDICLRVQGVDFTEVSDDETTLTFLLDLGYKSLLYKPPRDKAIRVLSNVFIKCSTGLIPPKKSRGKWSQGKKTANTSKADVDVSEESDSKPARKQTSSRRVIKKKATISVDDNIILEPDVALQLGKSINLTEAAEEEATRQVHATHARLMTESFPKPAKRRPLDIAFRNTSNVLKKMSPDLSQKLKGNQTLIIEEQLVANTMKALKERVPDEEKVTFEAKSDVILDWGSEKESEYFKEGNDDENIKWVDTNEEEEKNDDDDDKKMTNAEDADTGNSDEEITDTGKSPSVLIVPVFMIFEPSVLTPIPETPSVASVTTLLPAPFVFTMSPILLQITTPIPIAPITTKAPLLTTIPDPLHVIIQRVSVLEKDVQELKEADNTITLSASLKSEIPSVVNSFFRSSMGDALQKNALEKTPLHVAQSSSQALSSLKAAESLSEYELKMILFDKIDKSRSYLTHDKHQDLFDALLNSILLVDVVARGQADPEKVLRKRDRNNKDPSAGPNQGKMTKRSRTKESEPSKKSSTSKESSKGKSPVKTSKSGKFVTAKELVEEPAFKMASDDIEQTIDDVANDADQPPDDSTQTKDKDLKKYWFKQPPRPPTPDQE